MGGEIRLTKERYFRPGKQSKVYVLHDGKNYLLQTEGNWYGEPRWFKDAEAARWA